jgi:tetratricopeptide (TPR) repeat protein
MKRAILRMVSTACVIGALSACGHRAIPVAEPSTEPARRLAESGVASSPHEKLNLPLPPPPPAPPRPPAGELRDLACTCAAAIAQGRSEDALEAARRVREAASDERIREESDVEELRPVWGLTLARLGRWDDIMADPPPPTQARYATAMWHFVRASAFAAADRLAETRAEYYVVRSMIREPALAAKRFPDGTSAIDSLAVAERVLRAEIARLDENQEDQIQFLTEASRVQDTIPETALPTTYPWARLRMAAALLRSGQPREAEFALREQLARNPEDGWALWGLSLSLRAQGKTKEAERNDEAFRAAWAAADMSPDILYR